MSASILQAVCTVNGVLPPPPTPGQFSWEGDPSLELLTVSVDAYQVAETTRFAPCGIELDCTVVGASVSRPTDVTAYDPTYTDLIYVFVTGEADTSLGRNTRVGDAHHRTKSFRPGQQARHVWGTPGTYSWQYFVYERGTARWGKSPVFTTTVLPKTVITPARTIVVSNNPSVNWSLAPAHDVANRCTTLQQALTRLNAIKNAAGTGAPGMWRISFENGRTYSETLNDPMSGTPFGFSNSRYLIDTWSDSGAQAVIDPAVHVTPGNGAPGTFDNIRLVYSWDRMTDSPKPGRLNFAMAPAGNTSNGTGSEPNSHFVFHRCDIADTHHPGFYIPSPAERQVLFYSDCRMDNIGDYIALDNRTVAFINSFVDISYGAALGLMSRHRMAALIPFVDQWFGQAHNSIRQPARGLYIVGSYLTGRGGWSGQNDGSPLWDVQALTRTQGTGALPAQRNHIAMSVMVGDIQIGTDGSQTIIESSVIVYDPALRNHPNLSMVNGHAARNNIHIFVGNSRNLPYLTGKNVDKFEGSPPEFGNFSRFINISTSAATANRNLEILHSTAVVFQNSANFPSSWSFTSGNVTSGQLTVAHTMTYAPDFSQTPTGGVTLLEQPWDIPDVWMRVGWERQTHTLAANLGPGQTTPVIPYPNDWNNVPTTQASYAGTFNRHSVRLGGIGGANYYQIPGQPNTGIGDAMTITLQAGGFTVTNRHPTNVWPAGTQLQIMLDRGTTLEEPTLIYAVDQTRKRLPRPNQPQPLTPGAPSTMFDFTMRRDRLRPNAGFALSPQTGANSAGAMLPA